MFKTDFFFFTCTLPDYVAYDITKEFLKIWPFWKNDSWFSSKESKLTSVKYPWNYAFSCMENSIFIIIAPLVVIMWSVIYLADILNIQKTTFASMNQYLNDKLTFFLMKWVFTPYKESSSQIFKTAIFSKFFSDIMSHITW